ncbi:hypothetical protein [Vreelandella massiliensis]|uniref:hypothetical protein n=1 Tax=Vreelandella massiliensis TaxID=1816686 RepID=UPI00135666E8|nr:hypothetical protein [Halomonas massiliensis]MYL23894.1 hypothetical protein [Halomonas alkaliantarctica]
MPSQPIILPIGPSNGKRACDTALCAGGIALAAWQLELAAALSLGLLAIVFCGWRWHPPASRTLWVEERAGVIQSHWVYDSGDVGHTQMLRCDYLGPRLMRLNVGGERLWLWPDSAPYDAQRKLRRLLLYIPER